MNFKTADELRAMLKQNNWLEVSSYAFNNIIPLTEAYEELYRWKECHWDDKKQQWLNSVTLVATDFQNVGDYIRQVEQERDHLKLELTEYEKYPDVLAAYQSAIESDAIAQLESTHRASVEAENVRLKQQLTLAREALEKAKKQIKRTLEWNSNTSGIWQILNDAITSINQAKGTE